MLNIIVFLVSFLTSQAHLHSFVNVEKVHSPSKELDIINHSIKHSLAKIKTVLSPGAFDITEQRTRDEEDIWVLRGFKSSRGCPTASRQLKIFQIGADYFAAVATASSTNNIEIYRFTAEDGCEKKLATLATRHAFDFEVIATDQAVRLVALEEKPLAHPHKRAGSQVYTIFSSNSSQLVGTKAEVLWSERPTCITSWVQFGVPHVAICNNATDVPSYIYCARGGYFDKCGQVDSHSPIAIKHFSFYSDHYLAVVNQPHESKSRHVFTEIFRYDLSTESYKRFQLLPSKAAADVCFFTVGDNLETEHYLVVAANRIPEGGEDQDPSSHVYKVVDGRFEPFQIIPTRRALSCLAYRTDEGHQALIFSESSGVVAYQYNGWNFTRGPHYSSHAMGQGSVNLRSVTIDQQVFITATNANPSLSGQDNVFLPEFYSLSTAKTVGSSTWYARAFDWCRFALTSLKEDPIAVITDSYSSSVKKNDTAVKLGSVYFQNVFAREVLTDEVEVQRNQSRMGAPQFVAMKDLLSKVAELTSRINRLAGEMSRVISTTGNFVIQGPVTLHSLASSCRNGCQINELVSGTVNSIDVNEVYKNLIHITDVSIPSTVNLSQLKVMGGVESPSVANKSIQHLLNVNDDVVFNNPVVIDGSVSIDGSLSVSGLLGGRNISDNLIQNGNQTLKGSVEAINLKFQKLRVGRINGVNVDDLYHKSLRKASKLTLVRPTFKRGLDVANLTLNGLVNSIKLEEMYGRSMRTDGDQTVTGFHVYSGASVGSADLGGKFNWRDFPADFVRLDQEETISLKTLRLTGSSTFADLIVAQDLSGIPLVDGRPHRSIFLHSMNGTQVVTGRKTFHRVKASGRVATTSTINSRPPLDFRLKETMFGDSGTTASYGSLDITASLVASNLRVKTIKDMDLRRLEDDGVSLLSDSLPATLRPTFAADVSIGGDLKASRTSTMPSEHFIQRGNGPVMVDATKKFMKDLIIGSDIQVRSTINGRNLSHVWNNCLKANGDQVVTGVVTVENDVNFLSVQSNKSQMVSLRNLDQLTGSKKFTQLEIEGDWSAHVMDVKGLINDVDIAAWSSDSLFRTSNDQVIASPKKLHSVAAGNAAIYNTATINLSDLKDIVITENQSTVINSDLVIVGLFFSTLMRVSGDIDGVDSALPLNWLRNTVDQNISGSVSIQGTMDVDTYNQDNWNVGDIDIDDLLRSAVKTDENQFFSSLELSHMIVNNIDVNGTVQQCRVQEEFVDKTNGDLQTITGDKLFKGSLTLGSIYVANSINGEKPSKLCDSPPPPQSANWIIRGNIVMAKDADLSIDRVNNETLEELTSRIWFQDSDVIINHRQSFDAVVVEGDVASNGIVNDVNLSDLNRRYVPTLSWSGELSAFYEFDSLHITNGLSIDNLNATLVNDIEPSRLQDSVLLRSREQHIDNRIIFNNFQTRNMFLTGAVNGVDVNSSVVRNDQPSIIAAKKTFSSLKVAQSVEPCPTCHITGVDLSVWAANTVPRFGNVTVSTPVDMDTAVFERTLSLQGTINGIVADRDNLMTRNDDQYVLAPVSFSSKLPHELIDYHVVAGDFNLAAQVDDLHIYGFYDGVNLTRFYDDSVQIDDNIHFDQPVIISKLDVEFLTDDATNSTISDIVGGDGHRENHYHQHDTVVDNSALLSILATVDQVASRQAVQLKYFEAEPLAINLSTPVGAIYAWKISSSQELYMCHTTGAQGHLYCGSSERPVLESVEVTSLSGLSQDFAVTWKNFPGNAAAAIFSQSDHNQPQFRRQNLATKSATDSVAFEWNQRYCFLIAQQYDESHIYCRYRPGAPFSLVQRLSTSDARMVSVGYFADTRLPLLVVASSNHSTTWIVDPQLGSIFRPAAVFGSSAIIAIDSVCDDTQCYIVTVAPPEPVAIPGQIIIWGTSSNGKPSRLQRIAVAEPMDVKFLRLPNGRLALAVLQCSGIDNVMVYVLKGLSQFEHVTTIHVPGAVDLQVVADEAQVLMALTINQSSEDGSNAVRVFRARFLDLLA